MTQNSIRSISPARPAPQSGHAEIVAVDRALGDLRRGAAVGVIAADGAILLVLAAEGVTDSDIQRLVRLGSGPLGLAITQRRAIVLGLASQPGPETAALVGLGRDIDAATIGALADPLAELDGDRRFSLVPPPASAGSAVALAKLARLLPAALVIAADSVPADMLTVSAHAVQAYQTNIAHALHPVAEAAVPLADAEDTRVISFRPDEGGIEHIALMIGRPDLQAPVLTRLHSECFTGDLLGSLRCDCGDQLRGAIAAIAKAGGGVLLYLAQEGRGIGLVNKLRAYSLQAEGYDTLEANQQLGFDDDERIYLPAVQMLGLLGIAKVRLLTNNPAKVEGLARHGIQVVERVPHIFPSNPHNESYLKTKASRGGHIF
jgi:GTP cyclohydrolase II